VLPSISIFEPSGWLDAVTKPIDTYKHLRVSYVTLQMCRRRIMYVAHYQTLFKDLYAFAGFIIISILSVRLVSG